MGFHIRNIENTLEDQSKILALENTAVFYEFRMIYFFFVM